jgi:hypothetical protein
MKSKFICKYKRLWRISNKKMIIISFFWKKNDNNFMPSSSTPTRTTPCGHGLARHEVEEGITARALAGRDQKWAGAHV